MNDHLHAVTEDEQFALVSSAQGFARMDREEAQAEKARHIAEMKARQHAMDLRVASHIETHPEAIDAAKAYVRRFLASERHKRFHWILNQWRVLLETKTPQELAHVLRDTSEATEELRSSPPFCGINFDS